MSVFVVRAFVHLRDFARTHAELGKQLASLERRVVAHDADLKQVFAALRRLLEPPKPKEPELDVAAILENNQRRLRLLDINV